MKLLFVHGMKIKEDTEGNYYTDGSYSSEIWDRYLSIVDHLSVIARKEQFIYDTEYAQRNFNFFNKNRIKLIEVPNLTSSIQSFLDIKKRNKLNEIVKESVLDNDCIICRLPSSMGNIAIKFAKKFNKPYLVEVVGCAWDALWNHSSKGKIIAFTSDIAMKKSVKDASYTIYVTNEFLQRKYPCKGKLISCSDAALPPIDDSILEKRLKKIDQIKEDSVIILGTIGAVNVRYKAQENVIKAISMLKNKGYNIGYYLVGDGDSGYLEDIANKLGVKNEVNFIGSLPHKNIFRYLDDIDLYIQPSKTEGLPRALIEAMSRGCPAIGSNAGGIPELLEKDCIFNKSNYKELAELILKNSHNKEWLKNKAIRNFEKAKEYEKNKIELKRAAFLSEFIENCSKTART